LSGRLGSQHHADKFAGRGEHELADGRPVVAVDAHHVVGPGVGVGGVLGVGMRSCAFSADGEVAKRCDLCRAGYDSDVLRQASILRWVRFTVLPRGYWQKTRKTKRKIQKSPMECQYQAAQSTRIWRFSNWREAYRP
jgi:hypothetical protein